MERKKVGKVEQGKSLQVVPKLAHASARGVEVEVDVGVDVEVVV